MGGRYKDFPPGWGHLKIPTDSRDAALAALALYAPCRPRARIVHRAAWLAVKLAGPRTIPGPIVQWDPAARCPIWHELASMLRREIGAFDAIAGYERVQRSRTGFALLLLRAAVPVAFVKLRDGDDRAVAAEYGAARTIASRTPRSFSVPRPLLFGTLDRWHYLAFEPLAPGLHHPATNPPLGLVVSEIQEALAGLPRPFGIDKHWEPMHGDFAPWNLRETSRGRFLIDWEDCGWGPPGADEVFYRAAQTALGLGDATASPHAEAIEYWKSKIADRRDGARDARLAAGMNEALDRMRPSTVREPALGSGEQGERPRVLVFAYACEPGLGSEPGAGWGLVRALSEFANCVVLTAAVHVAALRVAAGLLPEHAIDVVAVAEPRWAPFARKHRVTWFLLYLLWLRRARATARDLATSTPFDVVHHATYSTYWLPSPVADFSAPAVWGAVGGAVTTPFRLWGYLGWTGIFDEILDFVAVRVMALLPATRRTWRRAAVRIVQNEATLWALPHALRSRTWVLNHAAFTQVPRGAASQRGRDLLLVASLESRKGVSLALHAVACASRGVRLTIVGDGPRRRSLERLARRLRVADRVTFRGRVPRAEVVALLDAAAAVVFTGMREEGGVALAEAMLCGAPVIVLANGGARTLAAMGTDATRVALIEPGGPKDTARRMGDAMTRFAENPPLSRAPLLDQAAAVRALRLAFQQAWSVPMPGVARVTQPVDAPTAPRE